MGENIPVDTLIERIAEDLTASKTGPVVWMASHGTRRG
jgi:hypothetical protein